jgi:hypothetical protein
MSIGTSGRIVIELRPDIKRELYSALAKDGLTLKDWFLSNTNEYLRKYDSTTIGFSVSATGQNVGSSSASPRESVAAAKFIDEDE